MKVDPHFPTILIAQEDGGLRRDFVRSLQSEGYAVLAAAGAADAVEIVRTHSRHIHVLITDDSANSQRMAATLKQYRPYMGVLFFSLSSKDTSWDPVMFDMLLKEVHQVVPPPKHPERIETQANRPPHRMLAKSA